LFPQPEYSAMCTPDNQHSPSAEHSWCCILFKRCNLIYLLMICTWPSISCTCPFRQLFTSVPQSLQYLSQMVLLAGNYRNVQLTFNPASYFSTNSYSKPACLLVATTALTQRKVAKLKWSIVLIVFKKHFTFLEWELKNIDKINKNLLI